MEEQLVQILLWVVGIVLFLVVAVVAAYLISRAASIAHYRTKLEYLRSVFREGAKPNGG